MHILILTPLFPAIDLWSDPHYQEPRTRFLYYYAAEWVRQGHRVTVIHSPLRFPRLYTAILRIAGRVGGPLCRWARFAQNPRAFTPARYQADGITVIRHPIPKFVPHRELPAAVRQRYARMVLAEVRELPARPDVVLSDWLSPSLHAAVMLRNTLGCPFYQILHQSDFRYLARGGAAMRAQLGLASGFLHRSRALQDVFRQTGIPSSFDASMFSGIPSDIVPGEPRTSVRQLIYVGSLRKTKHVHTLLEALARLRSEAWSLVIVGQGEDLLRLKALTANLGLSHQVTFTGHLPREAVFAQMRMADGLVMISRETFGMVYVEAMSQGCVVIGARGQGIDGIVTHGRNGFLVEVGDRDGLAETLRHVLAAPASEVGSITRAAIATAMQMRDDVLAATILERIQSHIRSQSDAG